MERKNERGGGESKREMLGRQIDSVCERRERRERKTLF